MLYFFIYYTYVCIYACILYTHVHIFLAEIEAKCPGQGHTASWWQSWDSNAALTPGQASTGETVPLAIRNSLPLVYQKVPGLHLWASRSLWAGLVGTQSGKEGTQELLYGTSY